MRFHNIVFYFLLHIIMENQKTYINGFCKAVPTQFGEIINFEVNPSDLALLPKSERGFVKISMMRRKETWKYWETHYMVLNTYQKDKKDDAQEEKVASSNVDDDLPFSTFL